MRRASGAIAGARRWLSGTWPGRGVLLALLALAVALAAAGGAPPGGAGRGTAPDAPPALADAVPYDGRSPREPAGDRRRVLLELSRPALAEVAGVRRLDVTAQRAYVASLRREAAALRGALDARGVELEDVVAFERTWNGFAATVRTGDLAAISTLGVRAQPVRRFYPAVSEPAVASGPAQSAPTPPAGQAPVALLASGVAPSVAELAPGHDAVDGDADPSPGADPRDPRRLESSGTALAGILARAGERVLPIRVAALRAGPDAAQAEEYATSDQLLAGLERAVDPDGDGDPSDHAPVALVGVNAPYAGFRDSPEVQAARGAARLGTLVVAPAGNEGRARPPSGTVGSPGAAAAALAAGALSGAGALPRADLRVASEPVARGAAVLAGAPPAGALPLSAPVSATDAAVLLRPGGPRLQGTLAVVRAGAQPAAQAAAAAAAGARAVVLAEPRERRPLPAIPAGLAGVPVLGLTGEGARALLERDAGTRVTISRPGAARIPAASVPSPFSARGPALSGIPKPDLAAGGAALTADPARRPAVAGGTAVAAALIAAAAARFARAEPGRTPAGLRAALLAAAEPRVGDGPQLPVEATGAGALPAGRAAPAAPPVRAAPASLGLPGRATVRLGAARAVTVDLRATGGATVRPARLRLLPGSAASATVRVARGGRPAAGRLLVAAAAGRTLLAIPFTAPAARRPVTVGGLRLTRERGEVTGVRFALGAFDRGDPLGAGTAFEPAERLVLELVRPGEGVVRRLTPPRGARELLPAEYAYTLPKATRSGLRAGRLAFRVRAWGPRQRAPTERGSEPFTRR